MHSFLGDACLEQHMCKRFSVERVPRGFDLRSQATPVHKSARCNARGAIAITLWTRPAECFMVELIPISGIRLGRLFRANPSLIRVFRSAQHLIPRPSPANFINTDRGSIFDRFVVHQKRRDPLPSIEKRTNIASIRCN